ncbi:MAG: response regulator [Halieaceae bacterium]|jgi:two-component system response regulator GlrR|nr:response regulator [Halieaceae bacterium]
MDKTSTHSGRAPASVLVVDDDASTRGALGQALGDEGYHVSTAASGNEAWRHFVDYKPHVVISDVRMRDGDGVALLEKIRAVDPVTPVFILMSGFSDISPQAALAKGANAYFDKPCWLADILDALEEALTGG